MNVHHLHAGQPDDPLEQLLAKRAVDLTLDEFFEFVAHRFGISRQDQGETTLELRYRDGHFAVSHIHRTLNKSQVANVYGGTVEP